MQRLLTKVIVAVAACVAICSCATLKDKSAGQIGCRPDEIQIEDEESHFWTGGQNWIAVCRGRRYSCAQVTTGYVSGKNVSGTSGQLNCSPMQEGEAHSERQVPNESLDLLRGAKPVSGPIRRRAAPQQAVGNVVERIYDEKRQLYFVRGEFALAPGLSLKVVGVPKVAPGVLAVFLIGRGQSASLEECSAVDMLVNARPFSPASSERRSSEERLVIESRFSAEIFEPLALEYSTLGVRACGEQWGFIEAQMEEFKKLLVIYEQLSASEVSPSAVQEGPRTEATSASN